MSVLFVPFDATKGHVRRNASNGVVSYPAFQDADPHQIPPLVRHQSQSTVGESPGAVMKLASTSIPAIVGALCEEVLRDQQLTPTNSELAQLQMQAYAEKLLPDVVFLSEQTTDAPFPDTISVQLGSVNLTYYRIGQTSDTIRVQTIHGYARGNLHQYSANHQIKKNSAVSEHLLTVSYAMNYTVAGVHLTSKNVGASTAKADTAFGELQSFCKSNHIDGVIGDLNLDVASAQGQVGALPQSTVFMAQSVPAPMARQQAEQFSSSNNKSHFMGALAFPPARLMKSLSLTRSLASEFFSDHAPIFAVFAWE